METIGDVLSVADGKGRQHAGAIGGPRCRSAATRQGGWRVAEATLPAAPASTLAVKVPGGETEVRLSQVPDRRSYDTDKDGQTIQTVLGAGGELALQWRPKVAEGQVDRGLTAQSTAVVDVQEDGLRAVWDVALEFRRNQREQFQFSVPKDYLVEKVSGEQRPRLGNPQGGPGREGADGRDHAAEGRQGPRAGRACTSGGAGRVGQKELAEFDVPLVQPSGAVQASGQLTIRRSPLLDVRTVAARGRDADRPGRRGRRPQSERPASGDESPLGIRPYQAYRFATMPFTLAAAARAAGRQDHGRGAGAGEIHRIPADAGGPRDGARPGPAHLSRRDAAARRPEGAAGLRRRRVTNGR